MALRPPLPPPPTAHILGGASAAAEARSFLVRQNAPGRPSLTWALRMWDASLAAPGVPPPEGCLVARTRLWPGPEGDLRAVLLFLADGEELLPVASPDARDLEAVALALGEAEATRDGLPRTRVLAGEEDALRRRLLERRGYTRTARGSTLYRYARPRGTPERPAFPTGYAVRRVEEDAQDLPRLAALLDTAFPRNTHDVEQLRAFRAAAPCYVPELDLVAATADDGAFAAHVSVCLDRTNGRALCEPVCTHPAHRRRGLARALMLEGMRRAHALGAHVVDVETGNESGAQALYESVGPTEIHRARFWEKTLPA